MAGFVAPARAVLARSYAVPAKPVQAFGITFKNPLGLAAGYDKDGAAIAGLMALGFGHLEIGTVTPQPQAGNPRPRMFRLSREQAIINRLGFPSRGAACVAGQLKRARRRMGDVVIGVNLGKNRDTPLEDASRDYLRLMDEFVGMASYLVINVSSPNTEGLTRLQGRTLLGALLGDISRGRESLAAQRGRDMPILVKLSPDLTEQELQESVDVILEHGMDGIIATNTTVAREGLPQRWQGEPGGLSGAPLRERSEAALQNIVKRVRGRLPIISVGGILTSEDVRRRLDMGATLIQIYTGMVFHGPGLVTSLLRNL